jgi:hypothetical protein
MGWDMMNVWIGPLYPYSDCRPFRFRAARTIRELLYCAAI